jgi:hypothetical protein
MEFYGVQNVYSASGVDLTLLRENMRRHWEIRLQNNSAMVEFSHALRNGMRPTDKKEIMAVFDPAELLRQLTTHRVPFVLIGGLAMTAHGSAHITQDLDLCYSRKKGDVDLLVQAMAPLHPYMRGAPPGLPFRFDAPTIMAGLNFTLVTDLGDVDVLGEVSGIGFYDAVLAQSIEKVLYQMPIRVLTVDGLISAKKAAGRTKDKLHLLELEEIKKLQQAEQQS